MYQPPTEYTVDPEPPHATRPWLLALILVSVLALIAVVTVAIRQPGHLVNGNALPADNYGPQDTATHAPTTTTTTTTTTAPKAVIPAVTPGWQTAYSISRNAVYDVPADWTVPTPTTIVGFEDGADRVVMSGASTYKEKACGDYGPRAIAGVTGSRLGVPADAARAIADSWSKLAASDEGKPAGQISLSGAEELTIQGRPAAHVTATIANAAPFTCKNTATAVVHAVAIAANNGQSVVMVIYADQDVSDAATADTMRQMFTTLRPANLTQAQCKQENSVVGTWC
ncbi:hypothetical protein [Nocardia inohanensis]|uniref:hypothetical protein n=1 Tax=Nocardia inohanensis TaxID=209246 RepID=UPI000834CFC0|nr:hypothetical protein [Nocardia inohanensis]